MAGVYLLCRRRHPDGYTLPLYRIAGADEPAYASLEADKGFQLIGCLSREASDDNPPRNHYRKHEGDDVDFDGGEDAVDHKRRQ